MGMNLLILGAGGFATEVEELARTLGYDQISFLDDNPEKARCNPIVGKMEDCTSMVGRYKYAIVALGNNEQRAFWHKRLVTLGFEVPSLISPLAYISPKAIVASGCIIRQFCVVGRNVNLGSSTILNIGAKIDHDCVIGDFSHFLVGAVARGSVVLPSFTWLAANEVRQ